MLCGWNLLLIMRFEVVLPLSLIISSFACLLRVSIACDDILLLLSTCPIPMITLAYTLVVCSHF
ncbi:hypothetical protein BDA96_06G120200 [Sorghum bicolor]|uniref:Uncharacterized protein n=1 Tax=Sorghum bicolor TaxID=4558 RepID=A0A921QQ01_SORBI|nr:hypothetical protein BDA96_06G120200 [Sorghum bicolor]